MIVLWMAGGMAQTETFDPKRYTPFEPGVRTRARAQHVSRRSTRRWTTSRSRRGWSASRKVMDRGVADPHLPGAPTSASSCTRGISFTGTPATFRRRSLAVPHIGAVIAKTLGPRNPTVPPFIAIGQNLEIGGESASLKAFHTAGFLGTRVRPVPHHRSAGRRVRGASAGRPGRRALPEPPQAVRAAAGAAAGLSVWPAISSANRCCGRWMRPTGCLTSPSAKAFDLSLEPKKSLRHLQHRPLRPGLPAGAAAGGGRRALRRGHHASTFRSATGTRTRTATSARR